MKEGYLQNKIREQNDKIIALQDEIKKLKIKIEQAKLNYDEAKELISNATDIEKYKKNIILYIKDDVNKQIKEQYQFIHKNNQKTIDFFMKTTLEMIKEKLNKELDQAYSFNASLMRVLSQKNILTLKDLTKIDKYVGEIKNEGFNKLNKILKNRLDKLGIDERDYYG